MITIPRVFNDFFENDFLGAQREFRQCQQAASDLLETEGEYRLVIDAPGCQKQDFEVELGQGNVLRVSGRREEKREEQAKYFIHERGSMEFTRSFKLPKKVKADAIQASYVDGVLVVVAPKEQPQEPEKVKVQVQ